VVPQRKFDPSVPTPSLYMSVLGALPMPPLVLITGATGHVGSCVLLHALRAGFRVRAAVRSDAKAASILARPQIQALNPGDYLSFAVVPDISAPGAMDDAAEGATHIIHIASPLVTGHRVPPAEQESYFVRPAVGGTLNMLEAASRSGTVRRVVITSSIVALVPVSQMEGRETRTTAVQPTDRVPLVEGPYSSEFSAYSASKVAALAHAEAWLAHNRPAFDVVHLHPSFVLGRNDSATTVADALAGTNSVVLCMLLGKRFGPYAGASVHVDDVARAHVIALDPTVPGDQSYILSRPARWNDARDVAKREFPSAMESRLLVAAGNVDTIELPIDASVTERMFGFKHIGFEEQVKSVVGQFLDMRTRGRAKLTASHAAAQGRTSREALPQVRANA